MSIVVETFLLCDGCGQTFGVDNRGKHGYLHRLNASKEGWSVRVLGDPSRQNGCKYGDYCSKCKEMKHF